ncbi:MAG: RNA 2',3'-cyclic phosphodiesterase [Candidatus Komeilibacteria bacterium]
MRRRIFIAINLSDSLKKEIYKLREKLAKFDWPVRWEPIEKIHLTLRFIGHVHDKEVERIKQIVSQAVSKFRLFTLSINGFVVFPSLAAPRVICLNIAGNKQLFDLQASIAGAVDVQGIGEPERHPFTGHITIGRLAPTYANFHALSQITFQSQCTVDAVYIISSVLKPAGSEYTIIGRYQLVR